MLSACVIVIVAVIINVAVIIVLNVIIHCQSLQSTYISLSIYD